MNDLGNFSSLSIFPKLAYLTSLFQCCDFALLLSNPAVQTPVKEKLYPLNGSMQRSVALERSGTSPKLVYCLYLSLFICYVPSLPPQLPPHRWHSQQKKQFRFSTLSSGNVSGWQGEGRKRRTSSTFFQDKTWPQILLSHHRVLGVTRVEGREGTKGAKQSLIRCI